jgi:hypothetical protein
VGYRIYSSPRALIDDHFNLFGSFFALRSAVRGSREARGANIRGSRMTSEQSPLPIADLLIYRDMKDIPLRPPLWMSLDRASGTYMGAEA